MGCIRWFRSKISVCLVHLDSSTMATGASEHAMINHQSLKPSGTVPNTLFIWG